MTANYARLSQSLPLSAAQSFNFNAPTQPSAQANQASRVVTKTTQTANQQYAHIVNQNLGHFSTQTNQLAQNAAFERPPVGTTVNCMSAAQTITTHSYTRSLNVNANNFVPGSTRPEYLAQNVASNLYQVQVGNN